MTAVFVVLPSPFGKILG